MKKTTLKHMKTIEAPKLLIMPSWIAQAVGLMHINKITNAELAEELNIAPTYLSAILNGKRQPKGIEEKIFNAIEKITINKVKNG